MILSLIVAASTLFGASCREASPAPAATPQQATARPEPNASDFDPTAATPPALKLSGERAYRNLLDFVALGPRPIGSEGHSKAEQFILGHLDGAQVEQDKFTAQTTAGAFPMNNIIAKFPGKKDGILVIAGHYDTNYPLRNSRFVGANDGGSNVGLMLELASQLKQHPPEGYSIWLLFTDGEEATVQWSPADSVYGSKHLAARWKSDGTAARVKAFLLLDMIGDKDLALEDDQNSTPWLSEVVRRAGARLGLQSHFASRSFSIEDDHLPFREAGIPVTDIIDLDYGFNNIYHHTTEDTADKCSAASLQVTGDILMESLRAINTR